MKTKMRFFFWILLPLGAPIFHKNISFVIVLLLNYDSSMIHCICKCHVQWHSIPIGDYVEIYKCIIPVDRDSYYGSLRVPSWKIIIITCIQKLLVCMHKLQTFSHKLLTCTHGYKFASTSF